MVGLPFVDSLVRGLLLSADHPFRSVVSGSIPAVSPRTIRAAVEIIEAEAHLPLTVSAIAARCHVSIRSLQQDFRRYVGTSPMAYLREVRLRRAARPCSKPTPRRRVSLPLPINGGFTNLGPFASAHAARYPRAPGRATSATGLSANSVECQTYRVTSSPHRQEFTRNMATPCGGICTGPMLPVLSVSVCAHRSRTR
jgi:hypothetical protein